MCIMNIYISQINFVGPIRAQKINEFTNHSAFWKRSVLIGGCLARMEMCFVGVVWMLCDQSCAIRRDLGKKLYEVIAPIKCHQMHFKLSDWTLCCTRNSNIYLNLSVVFYHSCGFGSLKLVQYCLDSYGRRRRL
jgi:hypothetical protein